MLRSSRTSHVRRCLAGCDAVLARLGEAAEAADWAHRSALVAGGGERRSGAAAVAEAEERLAEAAKSLAVVLSQRRHCHADSAGAGDVEAAGGPPTLEPRMLLLEFCSGMMLRGEQVRLLRTFVRAASQSPPRSLCHQLLMGAGKTTVIAPLLTLILADGERLVTLLVPASLLHFAGSVLRSPLSALLRRAAFYFGFERGAPVDAQLVARLERARAEGGTVLAPPAAVKSFLLKFLELHREIALAPPPPPTGVVGLLSSLPTPLRVPRAAATELDSATRQLRLCARVLRLWGGGVLVLDEVDWLLHPLKSELNWPLGGREPLDFAKSASLGSGIRWQLPFQLLDGLLLALTGRAADAGLAPSTDAIAAAEALRAAISAGRSAHEVQLTPHFVLLSRSWYDSAMLPPLSRWAVAWLVKMGITAIPPAALAEYVTRRVPAAGSAPPDAAAGGVGEAEMRRALTDDAFKLLNLTRDWLVSLLPHVLGKASRVSFGLLSASFLRSHPTTPLSRRVLAVPFVGKDCPSESSQFSHPDVAIGLTILAYRYEKLRWADFMRVMRELRAELSVQIGPYKLRPASLTFAAWVAAAGGRVRGAVEQHPPPRASLGALAEAAMGARRWARASRQGRDAQGCGSPAAAEEGERRGSAQAELDPRLTRPRRDAIASQIGAPSLLRVGTCRASDVAGDESDPGAHESPLCSPESLRSNSLRSPGAVSVASSADPDGGATLEVPALHLLEMSDAEQMEPLFELLRGEPALARHHLERYVFPATMSFSSLKLSASGQELGGAIVFGSRLGFSGTPSELLPEELGTPTYEEGDDARMLTVLTSSAALSHELLRPGWNARAILRRAATAEPRRHALIDTGALVTGLSNAEAASFLLSTGLSSFEACVYLEGGRKLVLRRGGGPPLTLERCGVQPARRFVFFDHVHTTGTDVELPAHARAFLTVGKDVTFRDLAQGAFRMRRVGAGQRVTLLVPPELARQIREQAALGRCDSPEAAAAAAAAACASDNAAAAAAATADSPAASGGRAGSDGFLRDACAWAVVNGLASESLQLARLCQQSLRDVWRCAAMRVLLRAADASPAIAPPAAQLARLMDVFCERMSAEVANCVPPLERTGDILDREARLYTACLADGGAELLPKERETLSRLRARALSSAGSGVAAGASAVVSMSMAAAERELVAEVVAEQEQEQEVEQTHEQLAEVEMAVAAVEDFPREAWARDAPPPQPWPLTALREPCGADGGAPGPAPFYPARRFRSSVMCREAVPPLLLPEFVQLSANLAPAEPAAKPRRLKNISLVLDWVPDAAKLLPAPDLLWTTEPPPLTARQERRVRDAFALFDGDGDGRLDTADILRVLHALDVDVAPQAAAARVAASAAAAAAAAGSSLLERALGAVGAAAARQAAAAPGGAGEDGAGGSDASALKLEVCATGPEGRLAQLLRAVETDADGRASLEQLERALRSHAFYQLVTGRFLVAVSLPEAEALRAALHAARRSPGGRLAAAPRAELALRHGGRILDGTVAFVDASLPGADANGGGGKDYLGGIAHQCFRFLDSSLQYEAEPANMLLRALQSNGMVHRRNAFASIRHCRRRRHADWRQHSVARVLTTEDEYQILHLRALLARVCRLMARRRLSPAAFFAACDRDRDAHVSWSELQTGLRWLGLSALDETVVELFLFLRKGALADATDGPPLLSRRDFLDAVEQEGAAAADWHDEPPGDVGEESSAAPPPPIRTESGAAAPAAPVAGDGEAWADAPPLGEPAEATAEGTSSIRTQLCRLGDFERVWDSTAGGAGGGGGRQKGAVWAPSLRGDSILRGASVKICLGHYALAGAVKPGRMFSGAPQRTVEVTDTRQSRWRLGGTSELAALVAYSFPPPVRYTLRWAKRAVGPAAAGRRGLYAWEGVPPEGHAALGMVCTATEEPPAADAMRCVPLPWVRRAELPPRKVWDDSGGSGALGSIWVVNSLGLIAVTPGHDPPDGPFYEPVVERMFADVEEGAS